MGGFFRFKVDVLKSFFDLKGTGPVYVSETNVCSLKKKKSINVFEENGGGGLVWTDDVYCDLI